MEIVIEPQGPTAVPPTRPSHPDRFSPRSTAVRRAIVAVLLVLSFALALAVMDRARREAIARNPTPSDTQTRTVDYMP